MFAFQIRQAAEAAPRDRLSEVSQVLWAALGAGSVSEDEAEALSTFIEARKAPAASPSKPTLRKPVGPRPHTDESLERRRRWAAAGRMPPAFAAKFTQGEQAALAVIAFDVAKRQFCDKAIGAIAALAGVSESTVKRAVKQAQMLGLLTKQERRLSRYRSDTNILRIISKAWVSWLELRGARGGVQARTGRNTSSTGTGCRRAPQAKKEVSEEVKARPVEAKPQSLKTRAM